MEYLPAKNALSTNTNTAYPLNILVVEDNVLNQKLILTILKKVGYTPILAGNGQEALELAQQQSFDLIFMDVQMPRMGGLESTRLIRQKDIVQPIIIGLTASDLDKDRAQCLDAGMDDYMSKPFNIPQLRARIEQVGKEKYRVSVRA